MFRQRHSVSSQGNRVYPSVDMEMARNSLNLEVENPKQNGISMQGLESYTMDRPQNLLAVNGMHHPPSRRASVFLGEGYDFDDSRSVASVEDRLKDFQQTLDMICSSAMDAVIIINETGTIKSVNEEALRIFEYNLWDIASKNIKVLMLPKYAAKHDHYLERYKQSKVKRIIGQVRTGIQGVKKGGTPISLRLKVNEIIDIHGTVFIGVIKDVGRDDELMRIKKMLNNVLPPGYDERIASSAVIADRFKVASLMSINVVDFFEYSTNAEPTDIISNLTEMFLQFDQICKTLDIDKIRSIGDCYMAGKGFTTIAFDSAIRVLEAALEIVKSLKKSSKFDIRIGISTGKVVSGVIKTEKLSFDVFGPVSYYADAMRDTAPVNGVRVCEETHTHTKFMYNYLAVEEVPFRGKKLKSFVLQSRKE